MRMQFKPVFMSVCAVALMIGLGAMMSGCSTNPATGESQFTALMSPQQEASVGAQEHEKVMKQYGGTVSDSALSAYVNRVGQKVAANTERPDVQYKFFVLDTPVVNAFALPGGYVYVTRGILALANSEAELAAVLAHEVGHITGRHTAERYSHGVVTSLGAAVLAAALDSQTAADAANVGSQLYLSSYSRGQESQADDLGIRYLHRAGYDTGAMARFLTSLQMDSALDARLHGKGGNGESFSYFSTHPQTAERVANARNIAMQYAPNEGLTNRDAYMNAINNVIYGDSASQGFVRGTTFWHPDLDMTFTAPDGYSIINNPDSVIVRNPSAGSVAVFDVAANAAGVDPLTFLTTSWMRGEQLANVETLSIGGKPAATGQFSGRIGNQIMTVQLLAVQWSPNRVYRFQMAWPPKADSATVDGMKQLSYSLRSMTKAEKSSIKPLRIKTVTAKSGDTIASLSARMAKTDAFTVERFLTLNGLDGEAKVVAGQAYKIIVE
ncbi:M48 family metalloprotease [Micavibrio aeruginosavorus]|uniref:Putative Zn-dependent protease n=1 Tax=Micavibrio aeruginosavorus EPB TaxID=349215 RepID=M4VFT3_9BACT|nr:M48 family metalloprotease [Micavibrio aeruginosavorus]AGH98237.1 Putative Zn-dependent protease [Micavibrio aeruginosavorus EPB]